MLKDWLLSVTGSPIFRINISLFNIVKPTLNILGFFFKLCTQFRVLIMQKGLPYSDDIVGRHQGQSPDISHQSLKSCVAGIKAA